MVDFRIAAPGDQGLVVELMNELIVELGPSDEMDTILGHLDQDIETALGAATTRIILAEVGADVAGLGRADILSRDPIFRLRKNQRCGYVDQMYVRKRYRKTGIGKSLLTQCEDWFRDQGIGHCILHASLSAVGFYARADYVPNREMFKKL
ncbi:MAG: GNAT family N-acetyltransferase [Myxococcota bacterium]|nr:GNAT family N-acetyltransferase [Myxococcota bacterium]